MLPPKKILLYSETCTTPGYVQLMDYVGDDALTCVNAARVSFGKRSETFTAKDKKLLNTLLENRHTSVLEHNVVTFLFKVPLFVARQHMRHRTWSYNEISRRYTSIDMDFYCPTVFRKQSKTNRQGSVKEDLFDPILEKVQGTYHRYDYRTSTLLDEHIKHSMQLYNKMLDKGICREQARMVLPQNLYTKYWGTVNLNNLIKFLELREHSGSQAEMQEVAIACKQLATEIWPDTMTTYSELRERQKQ